MIKIALDAMGGDFAPDNNIKGAVDACNTFGVFIYLVGKKEILEKKLSNYPSQKVKNILVVNADDIIGMTDSPGKAFRQKKNSSIHIGLQLVKDKKADAFVSPGNTGAVLTASTFILGRSKGVERPALASVIPTSKGPFILLDLGSNVDCKSTHLQQFAIMGHYFSKLILKVKDPRIGLLNIGEEKEKGNALTQETHTLLTKLPYNFIGNIEANKLLFGHADVVVCDGFVGNNILKFGESFIKFMSSFFKESAKKSILAKIGLLLLRKNLLNLKKKLSYDTYGGAQFLGLNGVSIIAHGSASSVAIKNAIKVAKDTIDSNMVGLISDKIIAYHQKQETCESKN